MRSAPCTALGDNSREAVRQANDLDDSLMHVFSYTLSKILPSLHTVY